MSPARIAELTEGQRGRMTAWAQEWTTRGLVTGPVDRAEAEEAIRACYDLAGVEWPGRVVWVPSLFVGALAAPLAAHPLHNEHDVRMAERAVWKDGVHQSVRGSQAGALSGALHMPVRSAVAAAITPSVHQAVMDGVHLAVHRGLIEGARVHAGARPSGEESTTIGDEYGYGVFAFLCDPLWRPTVSRHAMDGAATREDDGARGAP